ncbi:GspE/PulE family protein, partial [Planctomycetota bacterium]
MPLTGFNAKILRLLRDQQILDSEQYKQAVEMAEHATDGGQIDEILIANEMIDEEMYISAVGESSGLPPINLDKVHPEKDMREDVPEDLVEYHKIFPIARIGNVLTVAVTNPFDIINHDDFKVIVGYDLKKVISTGSAINRAIERLYHAEDKMVQEFLSEFSDDDDNVELRERRADDEEDLADAEGEAGDIVDIINKILISAVNARCTDIHFEPQEKQIRVRTRTDGILSEMAVIPKRFAKNMATRIKVMTTEMDIAERRMPQDGSFRVLISGRHIDFRVSSLPTVMGEKMVMRILDKGILNFGLEELGFDEQVLENVKWAIHQPYGMILCNGPTGCGKTTTLYTCIQDINDITENISTVEEPVEYEVYGINQVNVQPEQGRTFPAALRSLLRQDPDTILIGEIRDLETIDIAVKAALTGHRVFSTLHTSDAAGTITRILGLGVEPFLLGSSLLLILSQRLPRRLCDRCKEPLARPTVESLLHFGFTEEEAND